MKCNECGSTELMKAGKSWRKRQRIQQYRCKNCGKVFVEPNINGGKDASTERQS